MRVSLRVLSGCALLFVLSGCAVPTDPGPLPFSTTPRIVNVRLEPRSATQTPATATVEGTNFYQGLTLFVTLPDASVVQLQGTAITAVSSESFQATIPFGTPGTYYFVVRNTDEKFSTPFALDLTAPGP
jgi:hypothetical protein